jgi:hypothetical protein
LALKFRRVVGGGALLCAVGVAFGLAGVALLCGVGVALLAGVGVAVLVGVGSDAGEALGAGDAARTATDARKNISVANAAHSASRGTVATLFDAGASLLSDALKACL